MPWRAPHLLLAAALPLLSCAAPAPHPRAVDQVRRGYQHLAAGDLERSEVAFEHALEMAPELAEARSGLGVALRAAGRASEALVQFELALSADPDLAEAHVNRAESLAALGLPEEAEAAFADALRIDPDQVPARLDRARLLARRAPPPAARNAGPFSSGPGVTSCTRSRPARTWRSPTTTSAGWTGCEETWPERRRATSGRCASTRA